MVFIKKELLAKRLEDFATKSAETIWIELLIFQRKWCIIHTYRPPKYDKIVFFQELPKTKIQAINNCDNILGLSYFNNNHLSELTGTFNLTNLVKTPNYFKTARGTLLDVLLINKPIFTLKKYRDFT